MSKIVSVQEFRDKGYLQELNRLFLHPHGMALCVNIDLDGEHTLSVIYDSRADDKGFLYSEEVVKSDSFREKRDYVSQQFKERSVKRQQLLGYVIQSPEDVSPASLENAD